MRYWRIAVTAAAFVAVGAVVAKADAAVSSAVIVGVAGHQLDIQTSAADVVAVSCDAVTGQVVVTTSGGTPVPTTASPGVQTTCASFDAGVALIGDAGPNLFTVSDVNQFGGNVIVNGNGGGDHLVVHGSSGADTVHLSSSQASLGAHSVNVNPASSLGASGSTVFLGGGGADSVTVASGVWSVDGEDGGDAYHVVFGSLGSAMSIADTGATGSDALDFSDCSATVGASTLTKAAESIAFSGLESAPTCSAPPTSWPACGGGTTTHCIQTFTVGGGAPPTGVTLNVTDSGGQVNFQVKRGTSFDAIGSPGLALTSVVHIVLNTGSIDPGHVVTTGDASSVVTAYDAVNGNTVDVTVRPTPSSWLSGGCTPTSCGTTADTDFAGIVFGATGVPATPGGLTPAQAAEFASFVTASHGSWVATNAQAFALPTWNPATHTFDVQLAAPHFKLDGTTVNTGFFKAFLPATMLNTLWGIDAATASGGSFTVTLSDGSTSTVSPTVTASAAGVLIDLPLGSFHYSTPAFSIAKAPPSPTPPPAPTPPAPASTGSSSSADVTPQAVTPPPPAPTTPVALPVTPPAPPVVLPQPLVLEALLPKTVDLSQKPALTLTLDTSAKATVHVVLLSKGKVVAQWTKVVGANAAPLSLGLPAKAQKPGSYTLSVTTTAGSTKVVKKSTLKLVA